MNLSIFNNGQRQLCIDAEIRVNGARIGTCIIADSDKGFVQCYKRDHRGDIMYRGVGLVRKPIIETYKGDVEIIINGEKR